MAALLVAAAARCQDARQLLTEAQRHAHVASVRYEGVALTSNAAGATTEKHWRFERIGPFGESKILIRFLSPAEVEGVAILILNHRDTPADAWMWTPASGRVRSIALESRLTRFFGTDFSFEDLEEHQPVRLEAPRRRFPRWRSVLEDRMPPQPGQCVAVHLRAPVVAQRRLRPCPA